MTKAGEPFVLFDSGANNQDRYLIFGTQQYFEDSYIGRVRRNIRQNPRFLIALWNCHQLVIDNLPRTNNNIEGWHHAFQRLSKESGYLLQPSARY
uniref:Uncharacterized protein n=1 Tax=Romanomermis culicivorax TaxID=13658 RepID=A0A915IPI5_ROMCU